MDKVKRLEKEVFFLDVNDTQPNALLYMGVSVANMKWRLLYSFKDDELIWGGYQKIEYTSKDYNKIKRLLTKKYGDTSEKNMWLTERSIIILIESNGLIINYTDITKTQEVTNPLESENDDELEGL
ncbi:MAG: hypothetical protein IH950_00710 [Bacteroidetes bacterium]|nr:hypothetical protein [Bacteroidota bacterium]